MIIIIISVCGRKRRGEKLKRSSGKHKGAPEDGGRSGRETDDNHSEAAAKNRNNVLNA